MINILKIWLDVNKIKQTEFAKRVNVSRSLINRIVRNSATPSLKLALRIQKATNNEVMPESFYELINNKG